MVGDHNSFDDGSLETAITRARAASGVFVLHGIPPGGSIPDAKHRTKLARVKGLSVTADVDNQVVMSALLSQAGTSIQARRHADLVFETLLEYEQQLDDPVFVSSLFEDAHLSVPESPEFKWHLEYSSLVLGELTTQVGLRVV
jgi:hypothetical protein